MSLDGPTAITRSVYRQVLRHQLMVLSGAIPGLASVTEQDADPEHTAILQALVNRVRLEFLG